MELMDFDPVSRQLFVILILAFFVYIQIHTKPFFSQVLNDIEYRSLTSILSTAFFSLIYHFKSDDLTRVLTSILIILTNIYFLYMWVIQVLSTQYESIVFVLKVCPALQKFVISIKREFDMIETEHFKSSQEKLTATQKVRLSISKAFKRISQGLGNQKKTLEKRFSKIIQQFGRNNRFSVNKT